MRASRQSTNSQIRTCYENPKCCYDTHDLECPNKFNPPLLSTSTEFCTEALAKGIPIPKCVLSKPKKLQIEREAPPLAQPASARHLKNWQKWCYVWRETYNHLTTKRDNVGKPPVMSSGEVHTFKQEDKELFERTLHSYHLTGYYVKNTQYPDSLRPKMCGSDSELKEVITKRYLRDFPEMKRHRYPNFTRNEVSIPHRKISAKSKGNPKRGFNWEEQWTKNKHVEKMKGLLSCDIGLYGKTDPLPANLIFTSSDGPIDWILDKTKGTAKNGELHVPHLVFSKEPDGSDDTGEIASRTSSEDRKLGYYTEFSGPIMRVRSQFTEKFMTYSTRTESQDFPHFIGNATPPAPDEDFSDNLYFYDDDHHFSITTKCKETQYIVLKNEGTTAIRYQWFRSPPTYDAQQMLQDPTEFKNLRLERDESQQDKDDDTDSNISPGRASSSHQSEAEANPLQRVSKKTHLEFHFCSLPAIILPGQSLEFPIIFRSKKPGFFHETLYLLTHPKLICTKDGKAYAVRLSGVCTDVELAEKGNELWEMEGLKRFLRQKSMEEETMDLMDSILARALWEATNTTLNGSSLPNGRVTAESIFYAHNKDLYYYFGKSEKALELTRQLIEMLVPKERVESLAQSCDMSLQNMYNLVLSAKEPEDLNWPQVRSSHCEELLEKLDTECMLTLNEPRIFAWPSTDRRKYTACYADLVGIFDDILLGFDRLHNSYNSPAIKLVDSRKAEKLAEEFARKEEEDYRMKAMLMSMDRMMEGEEECGEDEECLEGEYFGEAEVNNVPSLTEPMLMPQVEDVSRFGEDTIDKVGKEEEQQKKEEEVPYWLAAFEEMMKPYTKDLLPPPSQQKKKEDPKGSDELPPPPKIQIIKESTPKEQRSSQEQESDNEGNTDTTGGAGGDAPTPTSTINSRRPSRLSLKGEITAITLQSNTIRATTTATDNNLNTPSSLTKRESTAPTIQEAMGKQVERERRQVLREARIKLFEDVLCDGIERMLATVDSYNNMLDYRDSDAVLVIDDKC